MTDAAPTPRTDAATLMTCPSAHFSDGEGEPMVPMEFARQLERDLAAAEAREKRLREALETLLIDGLFGSHSGHFDMTGGSGSGCKVCIAQIAAEGVARAALAETGP